MDEDTKMDKNTENSLIFIMDRIKKLTEALYRVTDLYSEKEPLKWVLRESAINLYDKLMSIISLRLIKGTFTEIKPTAQIFEEIMTFFRKIIGTLELASLGGFVSDINFEILKREYSSLMSFIENEKEKIITEKKLLISPKFPEFKKPLPEKKEKPIEQEISIGHIGQKISGSKERQEKILGFLQKNGKKTVKEIALIFQGISEKSIQRDLLELVKTGKLKAEGEKRWRVYFLEAPENLNIA